MTRNQKYEAKQKEKGLVKRTVWIPSRCECEVKQMIEFLAEHPEHIPALARNIRTGHLKKAVD